MENVLVIYRHKWLRGTEESVLLDPCTGMMCCLGFDSIRCGLNPSDINERDCPNDVSIHNRNKLPHLINDHGCNSIFASDAMEINDDITISDEDREDKLKKLFQTVDITVRFVE